MKKKRKPGTVDLSPCYLIETRHYCSGAIEGLKGAQKQYEQMLRKLRTNASCEQPCGYDHLTLTLQKGDQRETIQQARYDEDAMAWVRTPMLKLVVRMDGGCINEVLQDQPGAIITDVVFLESDRECITEEEFYVDEDYLIYSHMGQVELMDNTVKMKVIMDMAKKRIAHSIKEAKRAEKRATTI